MLQHQPGHVHGTGMVGNHHGQKICVYVATGRGGVHVLHHARHAGVHVALKAGAHHRLVYRPVGRTADHRRQRCRPVNMMRCTVARHGLGGCTAASGHPHDRRCQQQQPHQAVWPLTPGRTYTKLMLFLLRSGPDGNARLPSAICAMKLGLNGSLTSKALHTV